MAVRQTKTAVRGGSKEQRPWNFPVLKVDGTVYTQEITIPNTGQGYERAVQQAAQKVRKIRAAEASEEAKRSVQVDLQIDESTVPSREDSYPNSGDSLVDGSPVLSPKAVDATIREWLAAHLPSAEQLFSASASLVGLQGIDQRVRDLVASFQEGLDSYRAAFTSWFEGVQQNWAEMVANGEAALQQWSDQIAEVSRWRDDLEQRLFAAIADKVGPQGRVGNTGMAGAAVTVVDRLPKGKGVDFTRPYLKRDAVVGDIAIDGTTDMRYGWRWDGQAWERGPAMVTLQVRDVRISAMDASTKVNAPITIVRAGGSNGSSGGESLLVNRIALNAPVGIGDTSNHGGEDIRSGEFELELRALDGSLAGRTLSLITAFNYDGGTAGPTFTEYALDGSLKSVFEIDLSMYLAAAGVPTGVTTTLPSGAQALRTTATVRPIPGVTGTGGVTRFALRGSVEYNLLATGRAYGPNESVPQPLWAWG